MPSKKARKNHIRNEHGITNKHLTSRSDVGTKPMFKFSVSSQTRSFTSVKYKSPVAHVFQEIAPSTRWLAKFLTRAKKGPLFRNEAGEVSGLRNRVMLGY